jgi:cytosine/adenosine deaminase-related metal-dependent hydrolase
MHVAESREELELLRDGEGAFKDLLEERSMWDAEAIPRGSRPLDYLQMFSESPRALVIHGNYLDQEELEFLAARRERMSLVYCPRTHAYFSHAPYPLEQALDLGVQIALGTDSRASNPDLSLLAEMRHAFRTHPNIEPQQILRMGTLCGAEALGRHAEVGSITPGKLANLVAVPLKGISKGQPNDWLAQAFEAELPPSAVWCRGKPVELSEN